MKMKITWGKVIAVAVALLIVVSVVSVVSVKRRYGIVTDITEVRADAEKLYAEGETEQAIAKMEAYCAYAITDIDAAAMLGDWYLAKGDEENALKRYYQTAQNKKADDADIKPLSVKNMHGIITEAITNVRLEISPDVRMTKDMTLTVTNCNLVPKDVWAGKIDGGAEELIAADRYLTTEWFDVDHEGEYLTMSGGFNCAVWQFRDEYGSITVTAESSNSYRVKDDYSVKNYQLARVVIPEGAAQCRVTYFDLQKASISAENDEPLTIVYGRLPRESKEALRYSYIIPDLKEGEKIIYENSVWKRVDANGEEILSDWGIPEIERGSYIKIDGTLPGRVDFTGSGLSEYKNDGIYTVRFEKRKPSTIGERLDDAKNLGFKAASGNAYLSLGENDFDNIYPWSDMKLCNISSDGSIIYEGEYGYTTKGTSGDVFVEIPKFYSRRVADRDYDTISISGAAHPGFEVDEAFLTKDGEADKIYIAAYLSSVDENGCARSMSGVMPKVLSSADEIASAAEKNGKGYGEIDYAALFAVQKLFMVETAMRNSQYLYMGECALTIASEESLRYSVANVSSRNSNAITVPKGYTFLEGDGVIIFSAQDMEQSIVSALEDVRTVKTVIDNGDRTQSIYFSGEPMNITADVSAIAHVAVENGKTGGSSYHTATESTARGTTAFRYRNIENLWGDAYIYVDKVTVNNGRATIENRKGERKTLSYSLPFSRREGNNISYAESIIKNMGYDAQNPLVMLPSEMGSGATVSTYYGDVICSERNSEETVLYYGGSWYMHELTGLFCYNTLWSKDEVKLEAAGRMMYVK